MAAGYLADRADPRDHGVERLIALAGKGRTSPGKVLEGFLAKPASLPKDHLIEVKKSLGEPVSQWPFQSSPAHVVSSMAEHAFWQATGSATQLSVLFLYKVARDLMGMSSDSGAALRDTLKALRKYGCLPEQAWPLESRWLEEMPQVRDMEAARPHRGAEFCRLDPANQSGDRTLEVVLAVLAAGFPVGFGVTIYKGIEKVTGPDAVIPTPRGETCSVLGGQAFLATGYEITGNAGKTLKGRLKVRGSWGREWGEEGEAWLPFEYVTGQLARDFWVLCPIKRETTKEKKAPAARKTTRRRSS